MQHLTKLAVGVRDVDHLRALQRERAVANPPLRHRTRNFPRRRDEILQGGSMYWVIGGLILVRQPILDIVEDQRDDGTRCTGILLADELIPLAARPTQAFQGWRYLSPQDAPQDLGDEPAVAGESTLPPALRQELRALCLL
jgi:hypothetical protein